jgi:hypothetical protein
VPRAVENLGSDTLTTFQKAGGGTIRVLQKAGGDTVPTIQKAGDDSIKTVYKAAGDATATYVKAWHDIGEQGKRSFNDAVDAGKAAAHYVENQAKADINTIKNVEKRLREGKVVDSMWGLATEPLQSNEKKLCQGHPGKQSNQRGGRRSGGRLWRARRRSRLCRLVDVPKYRQCRYGAPCRARCRSDVADGHVSSADASEHHRRDY